MAGMRLAGVELYSADLARSRSFYRDVLGLEISDDGGVHHVTFGTGDAFLCLEAPGAENYPSRDKAVVFLEVDDLAASVAAIGLERFVKHDPSRGYAVLTDPDGHSVLLLQKGSTEA